MLVSLLEVSCCRNEAIMTLFTNVFLVEVTNIFLRNTDFWIRPHTPPPDRTLRTRPNGRWTHFARAHTAAFDVLQRAPENMSSSSAHNTSRRGSSPPSLISALAHVTQPPSGRACNIPPPPHASGFITLLRAQHGATCASPTPTTAAARRSRAQHACAAEEAVANDRLTRKLGLLP